MREARKAATTFTFTQLLSSEIVVVVVVVAVAVVVDDRFYIALFFVLEQTDCILVVCGCDRVTVALIS